jgi:hypothetical protein
LSIRLADPVARLPTRLYLPPNFPIITDGLVLRPQGRAEREPFLPIHETPPEDKPCPLPR